MLLLTDMVTRPENGPFTRCSSRIAPLDNFRCSAYHVRLFFVSRWAGTNGGLTRFVVCQVMLSDLRDKVYTSCVYISLFTATFTQHSLWYRRGLPSTSSA